MKAVTSVHRCIVTAEAVRWLKENAGQMQDGMSVLQIRMMDFPPPDRLIRVEAIVPSHITPDGQLVAVLRITELED